MPESHALEPEPHPARSGPSPAGGAARPLPAPGGRALLQRVAALLRLPSAPDSEPIVAADGSALICPLTGWRYPYRDGVLALLPDPPRLTWSQRLFATRLTAWLYDRLRPLLARLLGIPRAGAEIVHIDAALRVAPGDTILDLACGQGNFTRAWAERTGPTGLVIGLDISSAMLARAAARVRTARLDNVLLVRGDIYALPFAVDSFAKVNCAGGFHLLPTLAPALAEIGRVSAPGAVLTASMFAVRPQDRHSRIKRWIQRTGIVQYVSLNELGELLTASGYRAFRWTLPGGWFGYTTARKAGRMVPRART